MEHLESPISAGTCEIAEFERQTAQLRTKSVVTTRAIKRQAETVVHEATYIDTSKRSSKERQELNAQEGE